MDWQRKGKGGRWLGEDLGEVESLGTSKPGRCSLVEANVKDGPHGTPCDTGLLITREEVFNGSARKSLDAPTSFGGVVEWLKGAKSIHDMGIILAWGLADGLTPFASAGPPRPLARKQRAGELFPLPVVLPSMEAKWCWGTG